MAALRKEEMLGIAQTALATALKRGVDEAEVYVYSGQNTSVGIERGQITKSNRIIDRGLSIRLSISKAIGFAYTNIMDDKKVVENTISQALSAAKASKPDPEWNGFPRKKIYKSSEKIYDRQIEEMQPENLVDLASIMMEAATNKNRKVFPIEGGVGAAYISMAIANSNGIEVFDKGTMMECSLASVGREGIKVTPVCFEFNAERVHNIDPSWVGREAARIAISALKTKPIETRNTKIILTQFALQALLHYTLINALKADNVQRNQSAFQGKIGEEVAKENVTIWDDGLYPGGLRTWAFDGEGVAQQKTLLIEKGILRNFLYDNYSAKKEGKESTGNASRAGYLSTPNIEPTNFQFASGTITPNELLAEVNDGLIIYYLQGAHSSNPISGEFSVVATPAWKIKKGEIIHSTRGVMLAGNIFEVLKNTSAIANNERKIGQLISPWILVDNVRVIGK